MKFTSCKTYNWPIDSKCNYDALLFYQRNNAYLLEILKSINFCIVNNQKLYIFSLTYNRVIGKLHMYVNKMISLFVNAKYIQIITS